MAINVAAAVGRVLTLQLAVASLVSLGIGLVWGWPAAKSSALGALIAFLPNAYFALRIARSRGQTPKQIVRGFYLGEVVKLVLTATLFFLVLRMPGLRFGPLFAGFAAVLGAFWLALLLDKKTK